MTSTHSRRITFVSAAILGISLLTGCSSPLGGLEELPTAAPGSATFTTAPDAMLAPPVQGELVDGTSVDLSELWAERVLVLQFTSSWCTQCAEKELDLTKIAKEFNGAVLPVRIALNEPGEEIMKYLTDTNAVGPAVVDKTGSIWRDYAVTEPPVTAVIDTAGGLVRMWPGGVDPEQLSEVLNELVTLD